jgi:hypothetical protein
VSPHDKDAFIVEIFRGRAAKKVSTPTSKPPALEPPPTAAA